LITHGVAWTGRGKEDSKDGHMELTALRSSLENFNEKISAYADEDPLSSARWFLGGTRKTEATIEGSHADNTSEWGDSVRLLLLIADDCRYSSGASESEAA
jgi:hypothetical protein